MELSIRLQISQIPILVLFAKLKEMTGFGVFSFLYGIIQRDAYLFSCRLL